MSISLEALAMAGEDYASFGLETEEWERADLEETPDHLLAAEDEQQYCSFFNCNNANDKKKFEVSRGNSKLRVLIMIITAITRLTMLIRVDNIL
uniref:Uncharacterized protein n=1 Tax=Chenopodium quinoa TaxID=63459 RepID=A0A803KSI7_CHEQI